MGRVRGYTRRSKTGKTVKVSPHTRGGGSSGTGKGKKAGFISKLKKMFGGKKSFQSEAKARLASLNTKGNRTVNNLAARDYFSKGNKKPSRGEMRNMLKVQMAGSPSYFGKKAKKYHYPNM
jgi:hypothetical protein